MLKKKKGAKDRKTAVIFIVFSILVAQIVGIFWLIVCTRKVIGT